MRFSTAVSALAVAVELVASRSTNHVGKHFKQGVPNHHLRTRHEPQSVKRAASSLNPKFLTNSTKKFQVDGSAIPDVDFDIGESYAGLLPISSSANETSELYFWFFPSENELAEDEILIWLNGGPGCSSLEGILQENGPFLWQYGTFAPVPNPYTWINLTNVVWVEQPVGTGFSQGTPTATSEEDVAEQFMGFWKNFMDTFDLKGKKVYITGESYAGAYVPYIASAFLDTNNTEYFNLIGSMIYDPVITYDIIQDQYPAVPFVDYWSGLFPFNDTFKETIHSMADSCGYTDFNEKYLSFPPPGPMPAKKDLPGMDRLGLAVTADCDVFDLIYNEIFNINPCWDIYQVATTCPVLWDVLGFPGSFDYLPAGASIYFNRTDVQKAINAPIMEWSECSNENVFVNGIDTSAPSALSVLPGVIERSNRTIIGHGALDMVLIANGTLLGIQNMTWNGLQGFQTRPTDPFYVPYHNDPSESTLAGAGVMGTAHTERGLTFVGVDLSGHMIPQYAPTASYRTVEFLLGRIESLQEVSSFTTETWGQSTGELGNGTAPFFKKF